jgi:hypothetical protein
MQNAITQIKVFKGKGEVQVDRSSPYLRTPPPPAQDMQYKTTTT